MDTARHSFTQLPTHRLTHLPAFPSTYSHTHFLTYSLPHPPPPSAHTLSPFAPKTPVRISRPSIPTIFGNGRQPPPNAPISPQIRPARHETNDMTLATPNPEWH